jgi:hypothetical protein
MRRFSTLPCTGISGWIVHEDKMDEWKRRRQSWFMKGKEGRSVSMNVHAPSLHSASNSTTDPGMGLAEPTSQHPFTSFCGAWASSRLKQLSGPRTVLTLKGAGPSSGTAVGARSTSRARKKRKTYLGPSRWISETDATLSSTCRGRLFPRSRWVARSISVSTLS